MLKISTLCESVCDRRWFGVEVRCSLLDGHDGHHKFAIRWTDAGAVENLSRAGSDAV